MSRFKIDASVLPTPPPRAAIAPPRRTHPSLSHLIKSPPYRPRIRTAPHFPHHPLTRVGGYYIDYSTIIRDCGNLFSMDLRTGGERFVEAIRRLKQQQQLETSVLEGTFSDKLSHDSIRRDRALAYGVHLRQYLPRIYLSNGVQPALSMYHTLTQHMARFLFHRVPLDTSIASVAHLVLQSAVDTCFQGRWRQNAWPGVGDMVHLQESKEDMLTLGEKHTKWKLQVISSNWIWADRAGWLEDDDGFI